MGKRVKQGQCSTSVSGNKLQAHILPEGNWTDAKGWPAEYTEVSEISWFPIVISALVLTKAQQSECDAIVPPGHRMPLLIVTSYSQ